MNYDMGTRDGETKKRYEIIQLGVKGDDRPRQLTQNVCTTYKGNHRSISVRNYNENVNFVLTCDFSVYQYTFVIH